MQDAFRYHRISAGDLAAIPAAIRRRAPAFEVNALACAAHVMTASSELVFCSRYGNQIAASVMLQALAQSELLSPTAFSMSVHNAAPGVAVQVRGLRVAHTAIAAGQASLAAGAVESYARLATGEADEVVLAYADVPLPAFYEELDAETAGGLFLALRLTLRPEGEASGPAIAIGAGRAGAVAVLEALVSGGDTLAVGSCFVEGLAA
jgi:hypothetical protein